MSAAFTLVETLIALAVAGVLLGAAVPDLRAFAARQQIRAAATDLLAALHLARAQALGRGDIVVVAPADGGGVAWQHGWIVFADRDGDGRPGSGDEVLFRHGPVAGGLRIWARLSAAAPPWYVAYNSAGRSCRAGNGSAANWGTLSLRTGGEARNIKINMLGRARLCDPARDSGCDPAAE
ncbi:GspH/FimT family pseudopilin [Pseudoduganella chitinolytica]|uniref:Type II secretion system protein H n=1 Tax=Pseudoduganella chitinolytica TaxID=34070 RepID=A0ABY8BMB5_9BURK|nr:GspH/FimT family pseudopilin [Pseudoduganella chitinolytica]WEF35509.1 GspH/FimT family pseudopilin [Pseudoduganella chitinolytica]